MPSALLLLAIGGAVALLLLCSILFRGNVCSLILLTVTTTKIACTTCIVLGASTDVAVRSPVKVATTLVGVYAYELCHPAFIE